MPTPWITNHQTTINHFSMQHAALCVSTARSYQYSQQRHRHCSLCNVLTWNCIMTLTCTKLDVPPDNAWLNLSISGEIIRNSPTQWHVLTNKFPFLYAAGRYLLTGFQQRALDFLAPRAAGSSCLARSWCLCSLLRHAGILLQIPECWYHTAPSC